MAAATDEVVLGLHLRSDQFEIENFLANEREKDLLRFSTAGSVDDGKSTLIGRLLYDTQSVYDDQLRSIEGKGSAGAGKLDFALLTDGLRAEREQGITIDVAYRYFATARRKFIIADTPGHEQYTRNMATGASTADVAIVLVDARKGVIQQSRRHAYIASLLGVGHVVVAVNKMDLVGYDQETFAAIQMDFEAFYRTLDEREPYVQHQRSVSYVPVSALEGDNVVRRSSRMDWYEGPSLLELLETLPARSARTDTSFRMAVQRVIRPDQNHRSFAGQIASGVIRRGDEVLVLPSGRRSRVREIVTFDGDLEEAYAPMSISLSLEDEVDISRGDMLLQADAGAEAATNFRASLVWMDAEPLDLRRRYLLKQTSRTVQASVRSLLHRVDINTLDHETASSLAMNETGLVDIETLRPLVADRYRENRVTGSFVLIDPETNATVAAGMIREAGPRGGAGESAGTLELGAVTLEERRERWGHRGAVIAVSTDTELADAIERRLFESGAVAIRFDGSADQVSALSDAGVLVITSTPGAERRLVVNGEPVRELNESLTGDLRERTAAAIDAIRAIVGLRDRGDL